MSQITKTHGVAYLTAVVDTTGATITTDELNMKNYAHVTFLLPIGNLAGNATLTIEKCTSAAGAGNTAIAFNYRVTGAAAGSNEDTFSSATLTAVASTGLSILAASDDNKLFVVELDAPELGTSNWVRLVLTPAAAATLTGVIALLSEPRYVAAVMPSAIT